MCCYLESRIINSKIRSFLDPTFVEEIKSENEVHARIELRAAGERIAPQAKEEYREPRAEEKY